MLVGRPVPDFTAAAVMHDGTIMDHFNFHRYIQGKMAVVCFYPLDFTFVCPTELIALDHRFQTFAQLGVVVVAISVDSQYTHFVWRQTAIEKGGIGAVRYPLVADIKHHICQSFGVEHPQAGVACRASLLIDADKVVRHMVVNDLPLGRNMDELLRMVEALQHHQTHGEVCPAQWHKGKPAMQANAKGVVNYQIQHADQL